MIVAKLCVNCQGQKLGWEDEMCGHLVESGGIQEIMLNHLGSSSYS